MFCPKCGSLMHPKDGKWVCSNCGHEMPIEEKKEIVEEVHKKETIVIKDDDIKTLPYDESVVCPKCGHQGAYWMLQQTRSADEPETRFYICGKCGHRWREY